LRELVHFGGSLLVVSADPPSAGFSGFDEATTSFGTSAVFAASGGDCGGGEFEAS
jgi:hypothetical protein